MGSWADAKESGASGEVMVASWGMDGAPVMGTGGICCDGTVLIRLMLVKVSLFLSVLSKTRSTCTYQRNFLIKWCQRLCREMQMVYSMKKRKLYRVFGHTTSSAMTPWCGPQVTLRDNMVFVLHVDAGTQDVGRRQTDRRIGHHVDSIGIGRHRSCVMTNGHLCLQQVHYVMQILC